MAGASSAPVFLFYFAEIFHEQGIGSANWNYKSTQLGLINNDGSKNEKLIGIICKK